MIALGATMSVAMNDCSSGSVQGGTDAGDAAQGRSSRSASMGHSGSGDGSGTGSRSGTWSESGTRSHPDAGPPRDAASESEQKGGHDAKSSAGKDAASADVALDGGPAEASAGDAKGATTYSTAFPLTENPISENGRWINGGATGLDWGNAQTTPGLAFGTVVSLGPPYNDSTAVLAAAWPSDQTAQATVHTVNQNSNIFEEVELRLRTTIAAHSITGYEFNFRCTADGSQYAQIVRWNGPLNDFTYVASATGPGLNDGDVVKATAIGSTLTAYVNGTAVVSGTDSTYPDGAPGIGFYDQDGALSDNSDYGFKDFTATGQ